MDAKEAQVPVRRGRGTRPGQRKRRVPVQADAASEVGQEPRRAGGSHAGRRGGQGAERWQGTHEGGGRGEGSKREAGEAGGSRGDPVPREARSVGDNEGDQGRDRSGARALGAIEGRDGGAGSKLEYACWIGPERRHCWSRRDGGSEWVRAGSDRLASGGDTNLRTFV